MNLSEAIEYAAQHLPDGAEIGLFVEKDAATVTVRGWDGNGRDDFDSADMTLPEQIVDCVNWAIYHEDRTKHYSRGVAEQFVAMAAEMARRQAPMGPEIAAPTAAGFSELLDQPPNAGVERLPAE